MVNYDCPRSSQMTNHIAVPINSLDNEYEYKETQVQNSSVYGHLGNKPVSITK